MKCNEKTIVYENIIALNHSLTPIRQLATSPLATCREGQSEHRKLGMSLKVNNAETETEHLSL